MKILLKNWDSRVNSLLPVVSMRICIGESCGQKDNSPDFGTPEETNARYHSLLGKGQTGLSVAYDMPTLMGYDPDHPCLGRKGKWVNAVSMLPPSRIWSSFLKESIWEIFLYLKRSMVLLSFCWLFISLLLKIRVWL